MRQELKLLHVASNLGLAHIPETLRSFPELYDGIPGVHVMHRTAKRSFHIVISVELRTYEMIHEAEYA
jgi:hypothetical protein